MICRNCGTENPPVATFCMSCASRLATTNEDKSSHTTGKAESAGFVGRQREFTELMAALEDACDGRGRLVMLVGEPGIGKTRTTQELVYQAETAGCIAVWGRCYEEGGTPPYWPWLQVFNSLFRERSPEQLKSDLGEGASDIAEIAPELGRILTDLEPARSSEPEQARFRLFSSIREFFKNLATAQPLVVVLEDLHWADRSSLALLEFLARDIASNCMLVLGTYRNVEVSRRHPLSETLGSILREQGFLRLQLTGLERQYVGQLLQNILESNPTPELLAEVHQRTEGNPLFVGEIAQMLARENAVGEEQRDFGIPEGVRDAIGRRLNRLSDDCNRTLQIASVIGREFNLTLLRLLVDGLGEAELLKVLEESLEARVIEEIPRIVGRYQFAHALIQETLTDELTLTRRVQLHATIAQALEELYGSEAESHAAELSFHFAEAQSVLGTERLVRYARLASELALAAYAFDEALVHFEQGLVAKGISLSSEDSARDETEAGLLLGLAQAMGAATYHPRVNEIVGHVARAFDYYESTGTVEQAVTAASFDHFAWNTGHMAANMVELVERALKLVPEDSHQAGYLWAHYIRLSGQTLADYEASREAAARALSIARREHDVELEAKAFSICSNMDMYHLQYSECQENGASAIELADQVNDLDSVVRAHYFVGVSFAHLGDVPRARQHGEASLGLLDQPLRNQQRIITLYLNQFLAYLEGEWEAARVFANRGRLVNTAVSAPYVLGVAALTEFETGNIAQAENVVDNLLANMRQIPAGASWEYAASSAVLPIAARIVGAMERLGEADVAARAVLTSRNPNPWIAHHAHLGRALTALQRGEDSKALQEHYGNLQDTVGMPSLFGTTPDRILGLLSHNMGDPDQAIRHFEAAIAFCRKAGYRPELAWACCDYADTLLQCNQPGDPEKAATLLEESVSIATELGMPPLRERAQSRLDGLGSVRPTYPDGLTQREVEVLTLIAEGKNNREIGESLIITEATARRHVSNIYNKIGVANRAEATRYAISQGMV